MDNNQNNNNYNNDLEQLELPRLINDSKQPLGNLTNPNQDLNQNQFSTTPNNNSHYNIENEQPNQTIATNTSITNQLTSNENITSTTITNLKTKSTNKKKYFKYIVATLSILLLLIISTTLYYSIQNKKFEKNIKLISHENNLIIEDALKPSIETIEYNSTWTYEELVNYLLNTNKINSNTNIELYIDNKKISTNDTISFNKLGKVDISIVLIEQYNYKIITKKTKEIITKKDISLTVNSSSYPVIYGVNDKSIVLGNEIDILEGISAFDENDGILKVQTDGFIDFNTIGEYIIKVFAINNAGNKTEQEMKVTIFEETTNNSNSTTTPQTKPSTENNSSTNNQENNSSNNNSSLNSNQSSGNSSSSSSSSSSGSGSSSSNKPKPEVNPPNPLDKNTKDGRLRLATIEARLVAKKIFTNEMTDIEKANAIIDYLYNSVTLLYGQTSEDYKINYGNEAYGALILKAASSPGYCRAVVLLCEEANLKCQHININQWKYQWVTVEIDGKIYSILADQGWFLDYEFEL